MNDQPITTIAEPVSNLERNVEIVPFGSDERIKLNVAIVQKMIAVPTKTGKLPDATQCMKFMMLCKARHLNPFEGDAFLIGYDTQSGPQFSLITAHQVFLKRAEASEGFDGMESGVIVQLDGEDIYGENEGDFVKPNETLVGGWAKVYRKDRGRPFYRRLKLSTYNTSRSRWDKDPAGMIVKCAEADALRSAFPTHLGGLYIREEAPEIDITPAKALPARDPKEMFGESGIPAETSTAETITIGQPTKRHRRTKAQIAADEAKRDSNISGSGEPQGEAGGSPATTTTPAPTTPLQALGDLIDAHPAVTWDKLRRYLVTNMLIEPSDTSFEKLPNEKLQDIIGSFDSIAGEVADQE